MLYSKNILTKTINFDNLLFLLVSSIIFITAGNFIEDYIRLIFLKLLIIFLISLKINFFKETKLIIKRNKLIIILLISFIISLTISFITSTSKIHLFAFQWLRIRYLDTITDIFLFIFLYLYFKDRNINYNKLIKSIVIPGLIFSLFIFYTFISNKGISNTNKEIIFFDGTRAVGILATFLVAFFLGFLHSTSKKNNIENIFILTTFMTLGILLMGRGTIVSILSTYLFLCTILFINKKKFRKEFLIFIVSICLSILLTNIIFHISSSVDYVSKHQHNFDLDFRKKDHFIYSLDRINLWKYGYFIFLENPYFGKGPGGFGIAAYNDFHANKTYGNLIINKYFAHNHPHNFIIQFLVEWGIVGTLLIFILLIKLGKSSLKYFFKFKKYNLLIPGLSLIGLTCHGLIDGALFHATFTFYFVFLLSVLCSEISKKTNFKLKK